ncbi:fimbrillin family protein [Parabacteroides sp. OttesenSCG-928-G21]|nr:fimbrillin family protein [Parabacteroides sp. OttesenSCG-928-G21]
MGDRIGIYGVTDWAESPVMNNVRSTSVNPQTGAINWNGLYYYPLNTNLHFYSYYPFTSTATEGENYMEERKGAAPLLHFTITGQEDLLYAQPVTGSNEIMPSPFVYEHLLTQFHFVLIDEGNYRNTNIEQIVFTNVNTTSTLHVQNGTLGEWSNPKSILFPSSYPVRITGTEENPQSISGHLMLQPGMEKYYISIKITNRGAYSNIRIIPLGENTFAAGRSYEITLKFGIGDDGGTGDGGDDGGEVGVDIKATAWVTPWKNGGNGTGEVGE